MGNVHDLRSKRPESVGELKRKLEQLERMQEGRVLVVAEITDLIARRQLEIDNLRAQIRSAT
jgi:hypothetical protein